MPPAKKPPKTEWTTWENEKVTRGDEVAIFSPDYPSAVGEILGLFMGEIDFRITSVDGRPASIRTYVDEGQLIMKIPKEGR